LPPPSLLSRPSILPVLFYIGFLSRPELIRAPWRASVRNNSPCNKFLPLLSDETMVGIPDSPTLQYQKRQSQRPAAGFNNKFYYNVPVRWTTDTLDSYG
jgi:hypothetical protein